MRFETYLALTETVNADPQIIARPNALAHTLNANAPGDASGVAALCAAAGMPELGEVVRPANGKTLTREQQAHNMRCAQQLFSGLLQAQVDVYAALWAVNSWLNALAWPFALLGDAYEEQVSAMPREQRETLAARDDGYAAASLARECEQAGDTAGAARWRKLAYDCCDLKTLRWMERTAEESMMPQAMRRALVTRHAALGDPEGLAAYALYLLETLGDAQKAFSLASLSAQADCPAGQYALSLCLGSGRTLYDTYMQEHPSDEAGAQAFVRAAGQDAQFHLDMAARGGYPRAFLARAKEHEARGAYEEAYADLARSVQDSAAYAGVWDGAAQLARCCLERRGVPVSEEKAYEWAQQGAMRGCEACEQILTMLESRGLGTPVQPEEPAHAAAPVQPEEPAHAAAPVQPEAPAHAAAPVQPEEPAQPTEPCEEHRIIMHMLEAINRESLALDGEPAPAGMLVDSYLTCLCSAMALYEDAQDQDALYYDGIGDLCDFAPELVRGVGTQQYLHDRFAMIYGAMGGYRSEYTALFEREERRFDNAWARTRALECAAAYEIIDQLLQPDEQAQTALTAALTQMLDALNAAKPQGC